MNFFAKFQEHQKAVKQRLLYYFLGLFFIKQNICYML